MPHPLTDRPSLWPHRPPTDDLSAPLQALFQQAEAQAEASPALARRALEEALGLARVHDEPGVLPRCLYRAGTALLRLHDACAAYALCLEAQPLLERLDDRRGATLVLKLRGRCCLEVGEHALAVSLLTEAADRFERMGLAVEAARCESLLSSAYRGEGNVLAAVHFAARARTRIEPSADPLHHRLGAGEAFTRLLLARRLKSLGRGGVASDELDAAAAVLPSVEEAAATQGAQALVALDIIATVAAERGRADEHRAALRRLVGAARRDGRADARGLAWLRLAELRCAQGRLRAAVAAARRAAHCLSPLPWSRRLPAALRVLAQAQELLGEPREAREALSSALQHEAEQERRQIADRLDLLARHAQAERDLRDTEQTLAYAQRFSNVGYLVASVNHELNQPLASIRLLAETAIELAAQGHVDEVQESLRSMHQLSGQLEVIASKLASFPVRENTPLQSLDLRRVVASALALLQSRLARTPCEIRALSREALVRADEAQVVHVVANLINNALDAMQGQDRRRIDFSCAAEAGQVTLTIRDHGPGIADGVHERLFHPFFSTKAAGQGLGLGLALSRDALRAMGGELALRQPDGVGAAFDVTLPAAAES